MIEHGMKVTCNKCGKSVFVKKVRVGIYDDCADWPDGWVHVGTNGKDLCPDCFKEYIDEH